MAEKQPIKEVKKLTHVKEKSSEPVLHSVTVKTPLSTPLKQAPSLAITSPDKPIHYKETSALARPATEATTSGDSNLSPGFDRRLNNLMKHWYPLRFKLYYPKKSLLSAYEQKEFLEFHAKFRSRTKVTQSEVKLYKKYLVNLQLDLT